MKTNYSKRSIVTVITIILGIVALFFSKQVYDLFYYLGQMFGNAINN